MRTTKECLEGSGWDEKDFEGFWLECSLDYLFFAERVLGFEIANYHKEWYLNVERFKRISILAFRGSGKTSFFAGYILWKCVFGENYNTAFVSNSLSQSKDILKIVKDMINGNELLQHLVPKDRDTVWSQKEIITTTNCRISCIPYSDAIRGKRLNWAICDEAGDYEDKSVFWNAISPTVDLTRGSIIVTGTPKSHLDLLYELFNDNDEYFSQLYPIIDKNNIPLWKQKYTMANKDEYNKRSIPSIRREKGELTFQQEYMCIPISSANSIFPEELILPARNQNYSFLPYAHPEMSYYLGCDFAVSDSIKGDYSVFTILEVAPTGQKRIAYVYRKKGESPAKQKEIIRKLYNDFRPRRVIVDKTGLGETLYLELKEIIPSIDFFQFNATNAKSDMILNLRNEFENGNIIIPYSKEKLEEYDLMNNLLRELTEFVIKVKNVRTVFEGSGKHDDMVISLALALEASRRNIGRVSLYSVD